MRIWKFKSAQTCFLGSGRQRVNNKRRNLESKLDFYIIIYNTCLIIFINNDYLFSFKKAVTGIELSPWNTNLCINFLLIQGLCIKPCSVFRQESHALIIYYCMVPFLYCNNSCVIRTEQHSVTYEKCLLICQTFMLFKGKLLETRF